MTGSTSSGSWGIATPHRMATEAAATVLADGGTAVDAAICAAGVLTVVFPHNCSIGGDLIGLVRKDRHAPTVVYGVGRAARGVDPIAIRRTHGDRMPVAGPLSITVPGVVSGWVALHEAGGTVPFARLLEPAMEIAANGFPVSPSLARALGELQSEDPGMAEVFGPLGGRLGEGDVLVQPRLAETIERVAKDPDCYYRGDLAAALAAFLGSSGSPLVAEDFHEHRALVRPALATDAGRLAPRLFTADLPSQGAFVGALVRGLSALCDEGRELTGRDAHLLAAMHSEFSQIRDEFLCDPATPDDARLADGRLAALRAGMLEPTPAARPGHVDARETVTAPSGDTVAIVARDPEGGAVSILQSVFHSFGAKVLDPGTGVLFHNRGSMFTLGESKPGSLAPGMRPPHTLSPVMADRASGDPWLHLATMGGRAQPQILSGVLLALDGGHGLADAVAAPRFVVGDTDTQSSYRVATAERNVPAAVVDSLVDAGFDVRWIGELDEATGHAQALWVRSDGSVEGASDPRADGAAICGS